MTTDQSPAVKEQWLPVVGHEGRYEVSDHGRVRSLDRVTVDSIGRSRLFKGKMLRPTTSGTPAYPTVTIGRVHELVAAAFLGPRPPGHQVRHLDDVPTNNRLANLAYGTPTENGADSIRNGHTVKWTHCKRGHELTSENVYIKSRRGPESRQCKRCTLDGPARRGRVTGISNRDKTHCKHGHEFTEENVIWTSAGHRNCRTCQAIRNARQSEKRRSKRCFTGNPDNLLGARAVTREGA